MPELLRRRIVGESRTGRRCTTLIWPLHRPLTELRWHARLVAGSVPWGGRKLSSTAGDNVESFSRRVRQILAILSFPDTCFRESVFQPRWSIA